MIILYAYQSDAQLKKIILKIIIYLLGIKFNRKKIIKYIEIVI